MASLNSKISIEKAILEIWNKKKNIVSLDKCSGFALYILTTLYYTKKQKKDDSEYTIQDIGHGIASCYARTYCNHKVISEKFKSIDSEYDLTLDYLNNGTDALKNKMIDFLEAKRSDYFADKFVYDLAAIQLFFMLDKVSLSYTVEGVEMFK